ncbi:hypothetical protein Droror1_Dr00027101 [Drosera rotundifolia]
MFHFERGMNPELVVQVRSCRCTALHEMIKQAARIEDAMIAAREVSQKRTKTDPVQRQFQFGGPSKKKETSQPSRFSGSGGASSYQWRCRRCNKNHSLGWTCDGKPLTCRICGRLPFISGDQGSNNQWLQRLDQFRSQLK